ncbi:nuclease-related domain-containing protein [Cytobacillus dafuensis]|uniref:NERD domain-containing protein n=1 Tax=Cytobacillus dafuensis TaxID=1742359 RepID=A0A5B8Z8S0_CYTDA|nr:nuclease-related domain-containing protein [Cytobacillus dafuensis]QED49512.1 NERD domain-containing protein [Cytobacillus dafuensis]
MIAKERSIPLRILATESSLRRLPQNFDTRPLIEKDLSKRRKGYLGEVATDYYVNKLPNKEYTIFRNLRLQNGQEYFQLDTLMISSSFALILESKNIGGTLYFDSKFKQLIRFINDNEEGFLDPITQAERQKRELRKWLLDKNISIPIEYLIVISNPSTVIKTDSQNYQAFKTVLHAHELIDRIGKIKKSFTEEILTQKEIAKLAKTLVKNHTPEQTNVLNLFKIPRAYLMTGVQCPKCNASPMKRIYGTWFCSSCKEKDKTAHHQALLDYSLLIDSSITNQQFREFLCLSSADIAKKLLFSMNLPHSGSNKGRIYHLSSLLNGNIGHFR